MTKAKKQRSLPDFAARKRSEQELRRLATLPRNNPNPVLSIGTDGTILYSNAASSQLLEAWGHHEGEKLPEPWRQVARDALRAGSAQQAECACGRRAFALTFAPSVDAGSVNVYAMDITERKQAETTLIQNEARYRKLFEEATEGIVLVDAESGMILDTNRAYLQMTGFELVDLVGKPQTALHPAEAGNPAVSRTFARHREARDGAVLTADVVTKAGPLRQVQIKANILEIDGRKVMQGFFRDITTEVRLLKRLERVNRLQENLLLPATLEEKFKQIADAAIALLDLDFCRIWSVRPADLCDHGCIHAGATDERHACRHRDQCLHLIASSGRYTHTDGNHRRVPVGCYKIGRIASGQEHEFLTNSVTSDPQVADHAWAQGLGLVSFAGYKLHDAGGKPLGVLAVFAKRPLSEEEHAFLSGLAETASKVILDNQAEEELREKRKQAEAANRLKSEFLANMSHELRTPMTAILGFGDLLLCPQLPPAERQEFLHAIQRNGNALLELINDILDLSRIEADKLTLETSAWPLRPILDDVLSTMQGRAEEKGLGLEVDYQSPLPDTIQTDAVRLRQILVNLLGNALKFTEQGTIRITVRCKCEKPGTLRVQFVVRDTGIGIPAHKIPELFQPFMQVDGSATRQYGGTGLGLAISSRLAEALGGGIEVASEMGQGSTFTLTIDAGAPQGVPMLPAPPTTPSAQEPAACQEPGAALQGRVLLAEDVRGLQILLGRVLRPMKLEVEIAEDGRAACRMAEKSQAEGRPYDLILMDIQMPEMNGYDATQWLRRQGWKGPIVAVTAYAMVGDREKCLAAGCDDYLSKPIDNGRLREILARYLGAGAPLPLTAGGETTAVSLAAAAP